MYPNKQSGRSPDRQQYGIRDRRAMKSRVARSHDRKNKLHEGCASAGSNHYRNAKKKEFSTYENTTTRVLRLTSPHFASPLRPYPPVFSLSPHISALRSPYQHFFAFLNPFQRFSTLRLSSPKFTTLLRVLPCFYATLTFNITFHFSQLSFSTNLGPSLPCSDFLNIHQLSLALRCLASLCLSLLELP